MMNTAKSTSTKSPTLAAQAGQAVISNALFVPAKLLAEIAVNLLQLNILSMAAVGVLALIRGAINVVGVWVDLGIERALPKFIPEVEREAGSAGVRRLITRVMLVKMAVLVVFVAGLWWSRPWFLARLANDVRNMDRLSPADQASLLWQIERNGWLFVGIVAVLLIVGAVYDVLMAYLISYFRQRASNSITLANALVLPLLISAVVLLGWDITGVVIAMALTAVIGVALAFWQVARVAASRIEARSTTETTNLWQRFVPYSSLSYLFNLSDLAASHWFAVLLWGDFQEKALLWTAVNLVRQILTYLYMPMAGVQVPLFTRARAGEGGTLPGAYAAVSRVMLLLLIPGAVGLALLARPLVLAQYPHYLAAAPAIMLLTPLLFAESLLATSQNALMVSERYTPIIISRVLAFSAAPLLLLLTPRYGLLGAVLALGLARVLSGIVVFVAGQRTLDLRFPWAWAGRLLLASSAMGATLILLNSLLPATVSSLAERLALFGATLLIAAVAGGVFVVALKLLGGIDQRDRQHLQASRLPFKRVILRML